MKRGALSLRAVLASPEANTQKGMTECKSGLHPVVAPRCFFAGSRSQWLSVPWRGRHLPEVRSGLRAADPSTPTDIACWRSSTHFRWRNSGWPDGMSTGAPENPSTPPKSRPAIVLPSLPPPPTGWESTCSGPPSISKSCWRMRNSIGCKTRALRRVGGACVVIARRRSSPTRGSLWLPP